MKRSLNNLAERSRTTKESKRARWKKKDPDNERGRIAIRYRAYPTPSQMGKVMRIAGSCRFVKNLTKEQWDLAYRFGATLPELHPAVGGPKGVAERS